MRVMKLLVAAIAIAMLGGCATSGTSASTSRELVPNAFDADVDFQKMAIITEDALSRGYKIVWVHPPQKKRAATRD